MWKSQLQFFLVVAASPLLNWQSAARMSFKWFSLTKLLPCLFFPTFSISLETIAKLVVPNLSKETVSCLSYTHLLVEIMFTAFKDFVILLEKILFCKSSQRTQSCLEIFSYFQIKMWKFCASSNSSLISLTFSLFFKCFFVNKLSLLPRNIWSIPKKVARNIY